MPQKNMVDREPNAETPAEPNSIENRIAEEVLKTGFPTELVAASIMQSRGYGIIHNPSYRDDIERISREFDVSAFKTWRVVEETPVWDLGLLLVVECKKSEKPWVFFTSPEIQQPLDWIGDPIPIHTNVQHLSELGNQPKELVSLDRQRLSDIHHYRGIPSRARTYYEPFKGRDFNTVGEMIYKAAMSCTKAVIFFESEKVATRCPIFYYPVIVFSGSMFEATVSSTKSVSVSSTQYVQLSHHYLYGTANLSKFENTEFIIDVVHQDYLSAYLEMIDDEMTAIADSGVAPFEWTVKDYATNLWAVHLLS